MKIQLLDIYKLLSDYFDTDENWWHYNNIDEVIIGAILTQNTNWNNVLKALNNLKKHKLVSLNKIAKADPNIIKELIKPAGFYNQKSIRLIDIANNLQNYQMTDNVEKERLFLLSMKGIGNETADSILLYAYNKPTFVIDSYTKRIFFRIGLIDHKKSYDYFRFLFMENLPQDINLYKKFHALIVELAKFHCKKKPECNGCPLNKLCKKKGLK